MTSVTRFGYANYNAFALSYWNTQLTYFDFVYESKYHFFVLEPGMEDMDLSTMERIDCGPDPKLEYIDPAEWFIRLRLCSLDSINNRIRIFLPCACETPCLNFEKLRRVLFVYPSHMVSLEVNVVTTTIDRHLNIELGDVVPPSYPYHHLYVPFEFCCAYPFNAQFLNSEHDTQVLEHNGSGSIDDLKVASEVVIYSPSDDPHNDLQEGSKIIVLRRGKFAGNPKIKALRTFTHQSGSGSESESESESGREMYGISNDFILDESVFKQFPEQYTFFRDSRCHGNFFLLGSIRPFKDIVRQNPPCL